MQPQQQPGQFNSQQYDFIMNNPQPKKSLFGGGSNSKTRILILAIVGLMVVTFFIIIVSSLLGGGGSSKDQLMSIATQQTEIMRVAAIGTDKATGVNAKTLAVSTNLALSTDKAAVVKRISGKTSEKDLALGRDSETDTKLTTAEQNGTFDTIFTTIMRELLVDYQSDLESAYNATSAEATKQVLAQAYENARALLDTTKTN